ncbi:MAG: right-handed parallel beta-helix repeat-containing protein [Chitinispirillaceae bacterium]|nr:right-handed parallel beta-helix repeat-containing protein [Chitinispirillaceae bacterium]
MNFPHCFCRTSVAFTLAYVVLIGSFSALAAATYYVSALGSDQNTGRSETAALATLGAARSKLAARDTLLMRYGDIFRDSLNLTSIADPVIGAYGSATLAKPVISGSLAITGWAVHSGRVWVASCDRKIEKLFADNSLMTLARYPDTGWLRIDTVTESSDGSNSSIRIAALTRNPRNAAGYWNGSQVRWRRWSWWFETRAITSYAATGTLSLAGRSESRIMGDSGCKGWHLYIDKKFEELDAPGEWYYDSAAGKVYFYPPGGVDPRTLLVEGAVRTNGLVLAGGTVRGLCFRHQNLYGLSLSRTATVSGCRFEGIGSDAGGAALRASWDIADSRITGNVFERNLNIGISWYENSGRKGRTLIEYDTLVNTGTFPGYGGTGSWHAVGILVHLSSNVQVQYNLIDGTGYAGILLGSDSNVVQYNIIRRAMWTLNDGGAIYTDCSRSTIRHNIISDTKGDLVSSGPWYPLGHGIWPEFLGDYRENVIENNTVVRSGGYGIFLPNNFSCTIAGNVLYDNAKTQLCLEGQETNTGITPVRTQNLPQNHRITGNICCATTRTQKAVTFQSQYNYGTLQGNYFCNPYTDSVISGYGTGNNRYRLYHYTLAQWRSQFTWADASAKSDPFKRPAGLSESKPYGKGAIFINESPVARTVALGATTFKDLDGNDITGSISVPPYYAKVLVYADSMLGIKNNRVLSESSGFTMRMRKGFVEYRLQEKATVTISLFDYRGRIVFGSCNVDQDPGRYLLAFDRIAPTPRKRTQGVYAYRVSVASGEKATLKHGKVFIVR